MPKKGKLVQLYLLRLISEPKVQQFLMSCPDGALDSRVCDKLGTFSLIAAKSLEKIDY